jgi:hypothetical protein
MLIRCLAAGLAALVLSGAAVADTPAQLEDDQVEETLTVGPASEGPVLSVEPGEVLHTQTVTANTFLAMPNDLEVETDGLYGAGHRLKAGELLFAVNDKKKMFCTLRRTHWSKVLLSEDLLSYTCLSDKEGDGLFETIWQTQAVAPQVVSLPVWTPVQALPVPIALIPARPPEVAPATVFEIVYEDPLLARAYLHLRLSGGGIEGRIDIAKGTEIPRKTAFPNIVIFHGAQIELLGFEKRALRYRVLSGIPPHKFLIIR